MNQQQFEGILRPIVAAIIGWIAGKGILPAGVLNEIGSVVITLALAYWSHRVNSTPALVAAVMEKPEATPALVAGVASKPEVSVVEIKKSVGGAVGEMARNPDVPKVTTS